MTKKIIVCIKFLCYSIPREFCYRGSKSAGEIITENWSPVGKSETFIEESKSNYELSTDDCIEQIDIERIFPSDARTGQKFTLVQVWF